MFRWNFLCFSLKHKEMSYGKHMNPMCAPGAPSTEHNLERARGALLGAGRALGVQELAPTEQQPD